MAFGSGWTALGCVDPIYIMVLTIIIIIIIMVIIKIIIIYRNGIIDPIYGITFHPLLASRYSEHHLVKTTSSKLISLV